VKETRIRLGVGAPSRKAGRKRQLLAAARAASSNAAPALVATSQLSTIPSAATRIVSSAVTGALSPAASGGGAASTRSRTGNGKDRHLDIGAASYHRCIVDTINLHLRNKGINIETVNLELTSRAQSTSPGGSAAFLAPCLSFLCFIHCAGMALIAPWIPTAAALLGASWLEWPLIALSGASAAWLLRRVRAPARARLIVGLALSCTLWGLGTGRERAMQAGLLVTAAAQLILLVAVRRRALHDECCGGGAVDLNGDCCRVDVAGLRPAESIVGGSGDPLRVLESNRDG
jgi:hypothetical protein